MNRLIAFDVWGEWHPPFIQVSVPMRLANAFRLHKSKRESAGSVEYETFGVGPAETPMSAPLFSTDLEAE